MNGLRKVPRGKLFLLGLLSSFAFAPTYFFLVFFFSLDFFLELLDSLESPSEALKSGWLFGFGYFLGNCYWFYSPLLVEPLKYAWLIPLALAIIPAFLACYIALTGLFTWLFGRFSDNRFFRTLVFALLWTIFEYARGVLATGFAWNLVGYSLAFCPPLIQTVSIFGSHLFGFIVLLFYSAPYALKHRKYRLYSIFHCSILVFIVGFGFLRLGRAQHLFSSYVVRLVQPNLSQEVKNKHEQPADILENMLTLSLAEADNVDYVVWPETALPYAVFSNENNEFLEILGHRFAGNKTLITGAIRIERNGRKIYNSLIVVKNAKIIGYYDKYHLTPFGEFIPFSNVFKFLTALTGIGNFSRADEKGRVIKIDDRFPTFSPNICYESIFIDSVDKKKGGKLIVSITNDAWLGRTSGPYQHFDALKFRALENHIPAIRVANSGLSGVIDKYGRVLLRTKLNRREVVDVRLPLPQ
ncbi:MAG: apolipoprotein N-acyltransferase [Rickettsiales bacterium]|nr:apolipoprotein N-acyltransferase [Rickettsiales bacterium]